MHMLSCVWLFATPWTVAHQASLSMILSRQEYWRRLPFPFPGNLPHPGIKPASHVSPASQANSSPLSHRGMSNIPKENGRGILTDWSAATDDSADPRQPLYFIWGFILTPRLPIAAPRLWELLPPSELLLESLRSSLHLSLALTCKYC